MQLLHSSPVAVPQFASLSFLIKQPQQQQQNSNGSNNDPSSASAVSDTMGEPLVVASPCATVSGGAALGALRELHAHLTLVQRAADGSKSNQSRLLPPQDRLAAEMYREDADRQQQQPEAANQLHAFRPLGAQGVALHHRLLRGDDKLLLSLSAHIMASTKGGGGGSPASVPAGLVGIVFCVAVSGVPAAGRSSGLQFSLPQRMNDCAVLLTKVTDPAFAKVLLATFLLADDELRKTDQMVQAPNVVVFPEPSDDAGAKSLLSPMGMINPMAGMISPMAGFASPLAGGLKRLSRPMMGGAGGGGGAGAGLGGPSGGGADNPMAGTGVTLSLRPSSAAAALEMTEKLTVLSVAETDTFLRKYARMGQERKANLDLTGGGKSRFSSRRRKGETRDADLDNFDYKGPAKVAVKKKAIQQQPAANVADDDFHSPRTVNGKSQLRQPSKDTRAKAATPAPSSSRSDVGNRKMSITGGGGGSVTEEESFGSFNPQQQQRPPQTRPAASHGRRRSSATGHHAYDDDVSLMSDGVSRAQSSVGSHARMQVNIALNEDLSCSYKLSQLSSCSVEGVVQIQVKTTTRSPGPFYLHVKDPSGHVDAMQENKKFAEDVSAANNAEDPDVHHMFAVSIPKGDNYFPVLRYKCGGDLRPVPIRVQTRVKVDGQTCRVALQISSNPNNEASLTDLTIIMGVPDDVRGESLTTQPAGGVWNESKRSVIWCVSELGSGEKFQLQARFDVDDTYDPGGEKPKFPVLVRCQCLFAQLSDVELEVRDIPDRYPADVAMKLARRFRLSHRERS